MSSAYPILSQKLHWLSERASILSQNLALADLPDAKRRDVRPFAEYIKNPKKGPITSNQTIRRDFEMLNMTRNDLEHEGVSYLMKMYHKLLRTASVRNV